MGYPGLFENHDNIVSNCNGRFVRHHTLDKSMAKTSVSNALVQSMAEIMQKVLLKDRQEFWVEEPVKVNPYFPEELRNDGR
jgi:hypothetical protein